MHLPLDISSVNSLKYAPKEQSPSDMPPCCAPPAYPEVCLRGAQVEALFGKSKPVPGQVYEGSFQFRVSSVEASDEEEKEEGKVNIKLIAAEDLEDAAETDEAPEAE